MTVTEVTKGTGGRRRPRLPRCRAAGGRGDRCCACRLEEVKDGIWAPVPGKIVDVRVKVGDTVRRATWCSSSRP